MFHGQAGESLWTWYTNTSTAFSTPSQLHLSTPTWASQGPAGAVRPALKLEFCCPAQRPTHTQPWASHRLSEQWAVPFLTVLLLGHGLLFFFKADFQVITINQAMCQVPHRPPCLPQVRRNVGTCPLNTPLDVLGPVEAGRPWEGGEGKWGSTLLRGQGEGDREGHSWREDQEGGHLKCK